MRRKELTPSVSFADSSLKEGAFFIQEDDSYE